MNTAAEYRGSPRFTVQVSLSLFLTRNQPDPNIHATCADLSMNGLSCNVDHYLPVSEKILLTFMSQSSSDEAAQIIVQCDAIVVRVTPEHEEDGKNEYTIALAFHNLTQQQHEELQSLLESHADIL